MTKQGQNRLTQNHKVGKPLHIALLKLVHDIQIFALDLWFVGNRELLNRFTQVAIGLLLFLLRCGP